MQIALAPLGLGSLGVSSRRDCAKAKGVRLFGYCVPKLYVYGGAGAVALLGLLVLRRRRAA